MLENIHAHWKRRKVCKIKCKGVCTVDMDNVCKQLEKRTGKSFTERAVRCMRQKGRNLVPICKLGKNGVYCDLVANVREAFEECELVRINCQGLHESDYRRIGAKLRDLVPCTLLSFENEHILMWRGPNWRSSVPSLRDDCNEGIKVDVHNENSNPLLPLDAQEFSAQSEEKNSVEHQGNESHGTNLCSLHNLKVPSPTENSNLSVCMVTDAASSPMRAYEVEATNDDMGSFGSPKPSLMMLGTGDNSSNGMIDSHIDDAEDISMPSRSSPPCTEGRLLLLLELAVEKGSALVLGDESLDADNAYQASEFAKSAPPGPGFSCPRTRKVVVQEGEKQEDLAFETKENSDLRFKKDGEDSEGEF